jgi:hypothetical protein
MYSSAIVSVTKGCDGVTRGGGGGCSGEASEAVSGD